MNTPVRVRAQAHGGKYIGPAVATAPVLSVLVGGRPIIDSVTIPNGASGTVVPQKGATSSPYTIVVEPPSVRSAYYPTPGTYWLDPPADGEADVVVSLPLTASADVEFRVEAFAPQPVCNSVTMRLEPGGSYTADPGVVVPVPGLYVPQFTVTADGGTVSVSAKVQMMCGCPITQQPASAPPSVEPYWPSNEFEVGATFTAESGEVTGVTLACVGTDEFAATLTLAPGTYAGLLSAVQPSTSNRGSASSQLVVQR
jgi:hypothetical protein